ncbi:CHAD domain-containing protein [Hydrogenimonas sp.]
MKHFEIERRFVLYPCSMKRFLNQHGIEHRSILITQFYLVAKEGEVVRYRRYGDTFVRTHKFGSGLVREEHEEPIEAHEFEEALRHNRGGIIRKRRLLFELDGRTYELDSFKKPLKGLNVLEIEFEDESAAKSFELPQIFRKILAAEVTRMGDFSNGAISKSMKIPSIQTPLKKLLEQVDAREAFLKASVNVRFGPFESGAHALKTIIYSLAKTVAANRNEILLGSKDPERLHQLRVAMRKIRALFSQTPTLFEPQWRERERNRIAALMRKTGEMRDIDVYLAEMEHYRKMLPKKLHPGIDRLERYLKSKEKAERERVDRFLAGKEFAQELEALMRFAQDDSLQGLGEEAQRPVILPIKKALRLRYAKILKKGKRIDEHSPAGDYHAVRIEVKKLRYLMEFFSSILDSEAYNEMAGQLKSIQTILGKHQDLDVQREHLKFFSELSQMHDDITLEAIAELRRQMGAAERKKRAEFRKAFTGFAQTAELFRKMICKF